ncbi:protein DETOXIFICATION 33-like [Hevea brasiliensis]|uniref:protein DETOXIFICATION 33-like n=1 Tax=Hevea brasiliensis TaxID=3981 RepID=UPI0025DE8522|nr:protein DETOXIFICATION 33-like [Hevea brasiliensis]
MAAILMFLFLQFVRIGAELDDNPSSIRKKSSLISLFFSSWQCHLELWYFTVCDSYGGMVRQSEIAMNAVSICMNLQLWALMIALGFNAAISVRVSNELGAGNPKVAKFSVVVTVLTSTIIGVVFTALILVTKTGKPAVMKEASKLGYFLAATIFLNSIQPVLHGVAVGLPIGAVLGYKINLGVKGIWSGMLAGCVLQIIILTFVFLRTNWNKEIAENDSVLRLMRPKKKRPKKKRSKKKRPKWPKRSGRTAIGEEVENWMNDGREATEETP